MVYGKELTFSTKGFSQVADITGEVQSAVAASSLGAGIASVFAIGSTASISTIEYEPALVRDLEETLERFLPSTMRSRHSAAWGDDNGFSHLRATLMGPGITVPFRDGELILGTWQQIVLIDHDNRPRTRRVYVQVVGE
ncbi:MAG: YjbQ family protein [Spirochaetales bacterium]|nr:YjbQ family protein [Spirochaetales bacterium]